MTSFTMKPSSVLLLLFGLLASTALFAQSGGKDYLNFAPNGYVDSFKKTAPDGSFLEISEKRLNGDGSRVPIKVVCSNGEILEAFFSGHQVGIISWRSFMWSTLKKRNHLIWLLMILCF